jgi:hypothetical protein
VNDPSKTIPTGSELYEMINTKEKRHGPAGLRKLISDIPVDETKYSDMGPNKWDESDVFFYNERAITLWSTKNYFENKEKAWKLTGLTELGKHGMMLRDWMQLYKRKMDNRKIPYDDQEMATRYLDDMVNTFGLQWPIYTEEWLEDACQNDEMKSLQDRDHDYQQIKLS